MEIILFNFFLQVKCEFLTNVCLCLFQRGVSSTHLKFYDYISFYFEIKLIYILFNFIDVCTGIFAIAIKYERSYCIKPENPN